MRDRLIGAWKLVSYEERPVDGSASLYPFGEKPLGLIMYTPDGYMSAQLMRRERKPFAGGDWFDGTPDEYREEGTSYLAYSGRFDIDEENQSLTHSMFVSLFPNWLGNTQSRAVRMEGDRLQLSTGAPFSSAGRTVMAYITWQRAEPN
ncbi:lipocalin-like domain-containing protein [Paraburkholderia sp. ZP32-5]|uniref:lipocalin-like domain-containing protein n=1 Tax=Paraburkholderia sp. ZP32-5 TaxID=2883245 RepID=UPI0022780829|nr:lipocalin-like domain-containing protein [Paraburkholderia sp. ZP32-5]